MRNFRSRISSGRTPAALPWRTAAGSGRNWDGAIFEIWRNSYRRGRPAVPQPQMAQDAMEQTVQISPGQVPAVFAVGSQYPFRRVVQLTAVGCQGAGRAVQRGRGQGTQGRGKIPLVQVQLPAYIKVGRPSTPDEKIAKVNIIVPHTQGHYYASMNVYPCLYTITYERGR